MTDYLKTCEQGARAGGAVLLDWVGRFATREKGQSDLVTEADLASQEEIRRILLSAYPDHGFLGEEGNSGEPQHGQPALPECSQPPAPPGVSPGQPPGLPGVSPQTAEFRWLVDPLDGTTNYVHGIPHYCVSIALERRGELVCGTVFDPISKECFTAQAGQGSFLNGQKLAVSGVERIEQAVTAVSLPPKVQPGSRDLDELARVTVACQAIRRTGSAALNLCYLAAGRFDAYWGGNTKPWDIAAGALMIREAGGLITGTNGGPLCLTDGRFVAASTKKLHEQMMRLVGNER